MRMFIAAGLAVALGGGALLAQEAPAKPATVMGAAQIQSELERLGAVSKTGAAVTVSPGISVRRRSDSNEPQYAIIHPLSVEIYQILKGTATLVTGGTLTLPLSDSAPDLVRSTSIANGKVQRVSEGDVVVMPPGTPHWFSAIDGTITYMEARVQVK
jgi:mannose-6-phosphate isomerase-like protein (cupin superfamily)